MELRPVFQCAVDRWVGFDGSCPKKWASFKQQSTLSFILLLIWTFLSIVPELWLLSPVVPTLCATNIFASSMSSPQRSKHGRKERSWHRSALLHLSNCAMLSLDNLSLPLLWGQSVSSYTDYMGTAMLAQCASFLRTFHQCGYDNIPDPAAVRQIDGSGKKFLRAASHLLPSR